MVQHHGQRTRFPPVKVSRAMNYLVKCYCNYCFKCFILRTWMSNSAPSHFIFMLLFTANFIITCIINYYHIIKALFLLHYFWYNILHKIKCAMSLQAVSLKHRFYEIDVPPLQCNSSHVWRRRNENVFIGDSVATKRTATNTN